MTNPISDIEKADVILVTGSNTTETHPVISAAVKRAAKFGGKKLIVIDPREITLKKYATLTASPRPGSDVAWINGVIRLILNENLHAADYIKERTEGFEELKKAVAPFTPEYVEELSGIVNREFWTVSGTTPQLVKKVAYCTGSGSDFAEKAFKLGADVYITGDVKYHSALDTTGCIIDVGHFSLEEEMMRQFALQLVDELSDIEIFFLPAQDPMRLVGPFAE